MNKKKRDEYLKIISWAEKQRPELLIGLFLAAGCWGSITAVFAAGCALLFGSGILQTLGSFMVFAVAGGFLGLHKAGKVLRQEYADWMAENPDRA